MNNFNLIEKILVIGEPKIARLPGSSACARQVGGKKAQAKIVTRYDEEGLGKKV